MNNTVQLAVTPSGDMIPVGCYKTKGTQAVTLTNASTVYTSAAFSSTAEVLASLTLGAAGDDTITFTSKLKGEQSERISIQVAGAAGALAVAVTGKAILITPKADSTCAQVAAAIAANYAANELVTVTHTLGTAIIDATQAKAFLSGWDAGIHGMPVRVMLNQDGFIGMFSESETAAMTASMPVTKGASYDFYIISGDKITAKSATAGAIAYFTPFKQM